MKGHGSIIIVIVIIGILVSIGVPSYLHRQESAKEAAVKANCRTSQWAAEDWAIQNDGAYASSLQDTLWNGETIIDQMPDKSFLQNPYTGKYTEPRLRLVNGTKLSLVHEAGATEYTPVFQPKNGKYNGYIITGYNAAGKEIITLISKK